MKSLIQRREAIRLLLIMVLALWIQVPANAKTQTVPAALVLAKSLYLDNQTGNPDVLEAAKKELSEWGRFSFAADEKNADLKIVFSHRFGMDILTNVSFIVMDVFTRGGDAPVFQAKNAKKVIWDSQRRTKVCVADFRKYLEPKK